MLAERIMQVIFWVSVITYPVFEFWWHVVRGMAWPD